MKKRMLSMLLAIVMVVGLLPGVSITASAAGETSGMTGNVNWSYNTDTKTLTISGNGEMGTDCPWKTAYKSEIQTIVIGSGVTNISNSAFSGYPALTKVEIADTVKVIDNHAFNASSALEHITIPASVTIIGQYAFANCTALKTVTYLGTSSPSGYGSSWSEPFYNVTNVMIIVPDSYNGTFCGRTVTKKSEIPEEPDNLSPVYVGGVQLALDTNYINDNNGVKISDNDIYNVKVTGNDSDGYTLILSGANITGITDNTTNAYQSSGIISKLDELTIVVEEDSTITGADSTNAHSAGIYSTGSITISGSGKLTATGGSTSVGSGVSSGILANELVIDNAEVDAIGGTTGTDGSPVSAGIGGKGDMNLTVNGNSILNATGAKRGIHLYGGNFTVNGGEVKATSTASEAFYAGGKKTINGGTVICQAAEGYSAITGSFSTTVEGKTIRYTFADSTSTTVWDSNTVPKHSYIMLTVDNPDPIYHTITFITNGGKLTGDGITEVETNSKYTMQYEEGKGATLPRTITREGYVFVGWRDNSNLEGSNSGSLGTGANHNFTYYAKWDPAYTVTVVGGTGGGVYKEGTTVTITADAPEAGKMFAGWTSEDGVIFADSKSAETTFIMPAEAVTVTATYTDLLPGKVVVNGVDLVNGEDDHAIDCGDGTAVYDPATQTLTLTNATITTDAGQAYAYSGIYAAGLTGELKIVLIGENSITLTDETKENTGIMIPGGTQLGNFDLAITGPDPYNLSSLTMTLFDDEVPSGISYAGLGDLSISQVDLTINLTEDSSAENDAAIHSNNNITIENAEITFNDFWMGISSASGDISIIDSNVNISTFGQAIYTEGAIEIEGSIVRVSSENYGAITGWSDINITLSYVEAESVYSNGIYVYGHLTISDSVVEAYSEEWDAICAIGGMTVTNDAEVIAEGENVGIYTNDTLTVESGTVKAVGRSDIAILAQRISDNPEDSKPTDSPVAIVLKDGVIEASGSVITTDDWQYTEVWDDWVYDDVWMWMSQSYFTDEDGEFFKEANIIPGYTVVYDPGTNGTGDAISAVKAKGTAITLKDAIYTRVGYTQTGWATTDGGEKAYDLGAEYATEANAVLYPVWTANTYTVKFDANGGTGSMADQSFTYDVAQNLNANAFTYANKYFNGWNTAADGNGASYTAGQNVKNLTAEADGTVTLYAQWSDKPAQAITFDTSDRSATYGDGVLEARAATAEGAITYSSSDETVATVDAEGVVTVLKAGEVTITASAAETVDYAEGSASYKLTVAKKELTITVANKSVYVGSQKPDLSTAVAGTDYTVSGLVDGDSITVALSYVTEPVMNKAGEYEITATASDSNYTITVVNGKLKVSYYPVYPNPTYTPTVEDTTGGDTTVSDKNPEKGDKVTIITDPDKGYEVGEITVTDSKGNEVEVIDNGDGTYTYVQPVGKVTITVTYVCSGTYNCPSLAYSDLNTKQWYHKATDYVLANGLMNGVGNGKFDPNGTTSRAMIVTILWRLEGEPVVNYLMQFEDVAAETWYTEAVRWAASEKIVEGWDGKFDPMGDISREQFVTILWRYAKHKGYDVSVGENTNILSYEDAFSVSEYAIPAMQWACGAGLMQGDGVNLIPKADATRAQAAALFQRFCENVAEK